MPTVIVRNLAIAYAVMVVLFVLLLLAAFSIPSEKIRQNAISYSETLYEEGLYPKYLGLSFLQRDNFTESWMLGIAFSDDSEPFARRVLLNPSFVSIELSDSPLGGLKYIEGESEGLQKIYYGRYWHGYQSILRPMLLLTDVRGIRLLNWILFLLLVTWVSYMLYRRISFLASLSFLILILATTIPSVPSCLQYFTCYALSMIAAGLILSLKSLSEGIDKVALLFFITGGTTSFLDLLSTPLLTLGLPLAICLIVNDYNDKAKITALMIVLWFGGYLSIWCTKWIIASLFTDMDIVRDAISAVRIRVGEPTGPFGVAYLVERLMPYTMWIVVCVSLVTIGMIVIHRRFNLSFPQKKDELFGLLIVILIVPGWYLLTRNHSLVHWWFSWRSLLVTLFAITLLVRPSTVVRR